MLSQTPTNAPTNKSSRKALAAPKKRKGEKMVNKNGSKVAKSLEKEFDSCECVGDSEDDDYIEDVDTVKKEIVTNEEIEKAIAKVMGKNATEQETVEKSSVETVETVETSALETSSDESIKTTPTEIKDTTTTLNDVSKCVT